MLAANLVLTVGLLSMLQASLSLPGIAAVVFHLGIAVDANILIYERIREELRAGNSPLSSINAGFEKAFATIADSNVTTLIAGVVLFAFGTGTIRSFAIVMTLGILTSLFTSVVGSRALVHCDLGPPPQRLEPPVHLVPENRTMEFFHKVTTYPFMHTRRMWYGVSGVAIIASIVLLFWHGLNLGIDFTGGVVLEFAYPHKAEHREDARDAASRRVTSDAQVQNFGDDRSIMVRLLPQESEDVNAVSKAVTEALQQGRPGRRAAPRRSRRPAGRRGADQPGRPRGAVHVRADRHLHLVPLPMEDGRQRRDRDAARSADHPRLLRGHADHVRPGGAGGDPRGHRLLAQRHGRGVRPRARELPHDAQGDARRDHGRLDQPDAVANHHHQRRDAARRRRAADRWAARRCAASPGR